MAARTSRIISSVNMTSLSSAKGGANKVEKQVKQETSKAS